ncbi:MAG: GMC family oxidoreductase [Alphaproteobacteria bacterium]|nr:GMC family oxidoreductase [Alphaproteobacteria bacterium]
MSQPDVIIVGSGPAGVSAAWPLVDAGLTVLMVDAGVDAPAPPPVERPTLAEARRTGLVRWLLGGKLEHLRTVGNTSPKLRTAAAAEFTQGFVEANRIVSRGFHVIGTLSPGGLSAVWGAVACPLPERSFAGWPSVGAAMELSYRRVAERIGLSGSRLDAEVLGLSGDLPLDPPLPLSRAAHSLLTASPRSAGFALARPINAVLSRPKGDRGACQSTKYCMWRCSSRAIYCSADELPALGRHPNFSFRPGVTVRAVERDAHGWQIVGEDRRTGSVVVLNAPRVVLAAGALPTTRLALAAQRRFGEWLPLENTPCVGFGLVLPRLFGRPLVEAGFGMAQLCFRVGLGPLDGFGLLYDGDVVAASDIAARMPLTRPASITLTRALMPALMLGLVYLPPSLSANRLRLDGAVNDPVLTVEGGWSAGFAPAVTTLRRRLTTEFRRRGGWLLPGSLAAIDPGGESHLGATLPLGKATSDIGEVADAAGLYIVDAACLPRLPVEHQTLTVMANADRIASAIAAQVANGA